MKNDYESLSHTKWRCQYHIVLVPKYRRQIIYGKYKAEIGKILRTICERYEEEIIEANACKDHIHMLVSIPPKMAVLRIGGHQVVVGFQIFLCVLFRVRRVGGKPGFKTVQLLLVCVPGLRSALSRKAMLFGSNACP